MTTSQILDRLAKRRMELAMSKRALADRAKLSEATVKRLLGGKERRPSLESVFALAGAMGLGLRLEEEIDADSLQEREATRKAERVVRLVQGTMALEAQGVGPEAVRRMVRKTARELLTGSRRRLWRE